MAVAGAEMIWPRQQPSGATSRRWGGNLSLYAISYALLLLPWFAALVAAAMASAGHFGLLNRLGLSVPIHFTVAVIALDGLYYWLHRLIHGVTALWRVHAVHHSDPEIDVTTTLRHHPLEKIFFSVVIGATVFLFGLTASEVVAYAWAALGVQLLGHANLALSPRYDAALARVFVTPDFHRLHHSREMAETNSNYGEVFSFWDRLFGTAKSRSRKGHRELELGLDEFREPKHQRAHLLLAQPFLPQGRVTEEPLHAEERMDAAATRRVDPKPGI
ncbi:MAG: sterol desaturase family protein [Alphaproteobacteria bacterium]